MSGETHSNFVITRLDKRILAARIYALRTVEEANEYASALALHVARTPATAPILVADHRPVAIYPPEVTDRLLELFRSMNARLERVAVLTSKTNAVLTHQLERATREASWASRKLCADAREAEEHLAATLTSEELRLVREFLNAPR